MVAVTLRPMTVPEYADWHETSLSSYAEDLVRSGRATAEHALEASRTSFDQLLPDGLDSERTWLLRVLDASGVDIGVLWIGPHPTRADAAYIYDIEIDEARRGEGLGGAAMRAAERLVTESGATAIGLNVFGFNESARRLYDSLGYRVVATQMVKDLS